MRKTYFCQLCGGLMVSLEENEKILECITCDERIAEHLYNDDPFVHLSNKDVYAEIVDLYAIIDTLPA